ncbi:MAG: hypothetical protein WAX89_01730 [Alphaproteobacteria bacterium]
MSILSLFWGAMQACLLMGVLTIAVDFYDPSLIDYEVPLLLKQAIVLIVVGVSLFYALFHVLGGGLLGMAGGGVVEGLQMGLLMGLGIGMSRLWPYTLTWGIGCFVGKGPVLHLLLMLVTTGVLLGLHSTMTYLWGTVKKESL